MIFISRKCVKKIFDMVLFCLFISLLYGIIQYYELKNNIRYEITEVPTESPSMIPSGQPTSSPSTNPSYF